MSSRPRSILDVARTSQEVLVAAGSKYCLVPTAEAIREILDSPGRYAFVGLPCHVQAPRKAQQRLPALAHRVSLVIGLHCSTVLSEHYFADGPLWASPIAPEA